MSDWTPPPDVLPGYDAWLQTGPGGPLDDDPAPTDDDEVTWLGLDPLTTWALVGTAGWLTVGWWMLAIAALVAFVAASGWLLARAAEREWADIDAHRRTMSALDPRHGAR